MPNCRNDRRVSDSLGDICAVLFMDLSRRSLHGSSPGKRELSAALSAVTAVVVGVILNLAIWFGLHVLFGNVETQTFGPLRLFTPELASIDWGLPASLFWPYSPCLSSNGA